MKVFLSHARKDAELASALRDRLERAGFSVWMPEEQIVPGQNWALKTGKALADSDLMVLLLTPDAMKSDSLRHNIEFALGSQKYERRLFSVFVGPAAQARRRMPWILMDLPHRVVASARSFNDVVKDIKDASDALISAQRWEPKRATAAGKHVNA